MSKTNCINCGAAKEVSDLQCPFCGTKYADLTTFDLMSHEPIYIQLRGKDGVRTAKAYITNTTLQMFPDITEYCDVHGRFHRRTSAMNVSGTIDFTLYESL